MTLFSQCLICGDGIPVHYENGVPHAKGRMINGYRICGPCCAGQRTKNLETYVAAHNERMDGLWREGVKDMIRAKQKELEERDVTSDM